MRKFVASALIAGLLTACGANAAQEGDEASTLTLPTTTAATTSATPSDGPTRNERDNLVMQFGELARIPDASGDDAVTFTVDSILLDPPCTGYAQPPENGHFLVLTMRVTTGPDLSRLDFFAIVPEFWQVVGADGLTETNLQTAAAYGCVAESERLTDSPMGPGQQFVGALVLDSRNASGSAIFAPPFADGGWEWVY